MENRGSLLQVLACWSVRNVCNAHDNSRMGFYWRHPFETLEDYAGTCSETAQLSWCLATKKGKAKQGPGPRNEGNVSWGMWPSGEGPRTLFTGDHRVQRDKPSIMSLPPYSLSLVRLPTGRIQPAAPSRRAPWYICHGASPEDGEDRQEKEERNEEDSVFTSNETRCF